ncbi:uncharacterized protein CIMG_06625 [Coccidioides immitis RS]|uniref:LCCL domain-containing protein n=2 Tax=Coccidioides immitis TaxID=5501 RepID=J3K8J4_COCIM|nr:uncharacterized protein CIMG_06625 [Coccidioides immitis RS]EAS31146.3 hypothetical protein CIMG_06625 [Coccidioides immitis RS]KMU74729.1 hypothetical protein CISG_00659 [Coccidioides immitis RMSCC 3703]TPX23996.1 hypothetical protein DIZ76_013339 [Coccidioides immitis]
MAAPSEVTMKNLSGIWVMSKNLSDDLDPCLEIQGIPWIVRKAVSWATITGRLKQLRTEGGLTTIHIDQTATGGIKGESEDHQLNWMEFTHGSGMFGTQKVRTRWTTIDQNSVSGDGTPLDPFLTADWLDEEGDLSFEAGSDDGKHVQVYVVSSKGGWTAEQIWGFAMIEGERYHVRRFIVRKGERAAKVRMVYEWKGRLEES